MKLRKYLFAALAVAATASCVEENMENPQQSTHNGTLVEKVFEAYTPTKTALGADGLSVVWSENDGINVFDETASCADYDAFTVKSSGGAKTSFNGMADGGAKEFYALYPYSEDASWDYETKTVKTYLTHKQKASVGGFDSSAAISVASESEGVLRFQNVGALMTFTISSSDVKEIIIKSNNAEKLAGAVSVKFDAEGKPSIDNAALGTRWEKVQLLPVEGSVFTPGVYHIVVLPCTLKNGLTVNVTKTDNKVYSKFKKDEAVLEQGKQFLLGVIDSNLTYDRDKFTAVPSSTPNLGTLLITNTHVGMFKLVTDKTTTATASIGRALGFVSERAKGGTNYDSETVLDANKQTTNPGDFYGYVSDVSLLMLNTFLQGVQANSKYRPPYYNPAVNTMYDWATACINVDYPDDNETVGSFLVRGCYPFFVVFEYLKDQTTYMTAEQQAAITAWFRKIADEVKLSITLWQQNDYFGSQYYQNMSAAHMWGLLSIGYAIDDPSLVEFAVDSIDNPRDFYDCLQGCILMEGDTPSLRDPNHVAPQTGEIIDRYRHTTATNKGLQYTSLTLQILSTAARTMKNNGLNLYDYTCPTGENLKLAYEFYAPFYAQNRADLKGGYYTGEDSRIGIAGDLHGLFELGYDAYPNSDAIKSVINNIPDRASNAKAASDVNNATIRQMHPQLGYTRLLSVSVDNAN